MAGSAPSAFIFLMTALIVSASVSIILVDSWKGIADTYADNRDGAALDAKTEFSFAGNPMMVNYDANNQIMVFYLQNTGQVTLETNIGGVFVNGVVPEDNIASTLVGSATIWVPGELLELELEDTINWATYVDGDEVGLTLIANSVLMKGVRGTYALTMTVRLA